LGPSGRVGRDIPSQAGKGHRIREIHPLPLPTPSPFIPLGSHAQATFPASLPDFLRFPLRQRPIRNSAEIGSVSSSSDTPSLLTPWDLNTPRAVDTPYVRLAPPHTPRRFPPASPARPTWSCSRRRSATFRVDSPARQPASHLPAISARDPHGQYPGAGGAGRPQLHSLVSVPNRTGKSLPHLKVSPFRLYPGFPFPRLMASISPDPSSPPQTLFTPGCTIRGGGISIDTPEGPPLGGGVVSGCMASHAHTGSHSANIRRPVPAPSRGPTPGMEAGLLARPSPCFAASLP
jgi:hypothetical protein